MLFYFLTITLSYMFKVYSGHYPTWQSLAHDYLAVMASSVSSERAFSSAGITICKRRNCLDGDIVKALQCLKMLIHQDLMSRGMTTVAEEEAHLDQEDEERGNANFTMAEVMNGNNAWLSDGEEEVTMDGNETEIDLTGSQ